MQNRLPPLSLPEQFSLVLSSMHFMGQVKSNHVQATCDYIWTRTQKRLYLLKLTPHFLFCFESKLFRSPSSMAISWSFVRSDFWLLWKKKMSYPLFKKDATLPPGHPPPGYLMLANLTNKFIPADRGEAHLNDVRFNSNLIFFSPIMIEGRFTSRLGFSQH